MFPLLSHALSSAFGSVCCYATWSEALSQEVTRRTHGLSQSRFLPRKTVIWWRQDWNRQKQGGASALGSASGLSLGILPGLCAGVCDPASCGACFSNFEAHCVQARQLRPEGAQPGIKWNWPYSATAASQGGCIDGWQHPQRRRVLRIGVGAQWFSGAIGEGAAMGVTLQRSSDCNLCPGSRAGWWERASLRSKAWGRFLVFLDYIIIFLLKYNCFAMFY